MSILLIGFIVVGLSSSLLFVLGGMAAARSDMQDVKRFGAWLSVDA